MIMMMISSDSDCYVDERAERYVQEATSPVFTLDGLYLLYVDRGCTVIAYSLSDLAPKYHVPGCSAHQLVALPVHHRLFLATRFLVDENRQKSAVVSVADISSRFPSDYLIY